MSFRRLSTISSFDQSVVNDIAHQRTLKQHVRDCQTSARGVEPATRRGDPGCRQVRRHPTDSTSCPGFCWAVSTGWPLSSGNLTAPFAKRKSGSDVKFHSRVKDKVVIVTGTESTREHPMTVPIILKVTSAFKDAILPTELVAPRPTSSPTMAPAPSTCATTSTITSPRTSERLNRSTPAAMCMCVNSTRRTRRP